MSLNGISRALILASLLLIAQPARAEPCPANTALLEESILQAEAAFEEMNLEAYTIAVRVASSMLVCTTDPIPRALAARVHRMTGLDRFVARDEERARIAFAAARAIEPGYQFPPELLPEGHPAQTLYQALPPRGASVRVARPAAGTLLFDGIESLDRPTERPTVLQRLDDAGVVAETLYLWPEDAPGWLMPEQPAPVARSRHGADQRSQRVTGWSLIGTAVAAGLSSAALYRVAREESTVYWDPQTPAGELDALRDRVNTHQGLALGAAALGLGAGVGATVVFVWN